MTPSIQQVAELALTNYACIDTFHKSIGCPQFACEHCIFWKAFASPKCLFWATNSNFPNDTYTYLELHHPEILL